MSPVHFDSDSCKTATSYDYFQLRYTLAHFSCPLCFIFNSFKIHSISISHVPTTCLAIILGVEYTMVNKTD